MSDTWDDIQAFKKRQNSLREKFQKRKKEREEIVQSIVSDFAPTQVLQPNISPPSSSSSPNLSTQTSKPEPVVIGIGSLISQTTVGTSQTSLCSESAISFDAGDDKCKKETEIGIEKGVGADPFVERRLLQCLCDLALNLPMDSRALLSTINKTLLDQEGVSHFLLENLLQKFAAQELITIKEGFSADGKTCVVIIGAEHTKLVAVVNELDAGCQKSSNEPKLQRDIGTTEEPLKKVVSVTVRRDGAKQPKRRNVETIESLLSLPSTREKESKKMGEEILDLLSKPTAKERSLAERFRSQGGAQVQEFCPHGTKEECIKLSGNCEPCHKLHFKKIIQKHTDESLGDCSFLNTCFHMDTCKYVHYEVDHSTLPTSQDKAPKQEEDKENAVNLSAKDKAVATLYPAQWIQCDLRYFDMTILGKFAVVMADPPWDIHMELPYGTMSDNEMRQLNIPTLQEEGLIFLWVTGRAMELGRECLKLWGYERCDEIIWVKTNQLQRIIRTGRTGHWLNHGKEHCLVGMKGGATSINCGLDCDVIVAEVRATSHKPDEIYGMIERLSPGTRKIELFGRPHNIQPNWITLGNQVDGVRLLDPDLVRRFQERYPDGNCMVPPNMMSKT